MATSEENDLIGYDPLAWMDGLADQKEQETDDMIAEQEGAADDDEITMADVYSDDLTASIEEDAAKEDEQASTEESGDACMAETAVESMSAESTNGWGESEAEAGGGLSSGSEESDGPLMDLDATLSIQNVVKLHEKLKGVLANYDQIEINASDVSSIDTATLQLLVSLKKEAAKLQKQVTIIYPSPRFVESAQLLGLSDVLGINGA